jgi:hypothetical protein
VLVGEIKIDVAVVLGDADVDGALGSVKLRPRLEQIELRADRLPDGFFAFDSSRHPDRLVPFGDRDFLTAFQRESRSENSCARC